MSRSPTIEDMHDADSLTALPDEAVPGFLVEVAATLTKTAARLMSRRGPTRPSVGSPPGQRLSTKQLAVRMGRSVDYVYRHCSEWPFTLRDGRNISFDEAGFVKWQETRLRRKVC